MIFINSMMVLFSSVVGIYVINGLLERFYDARNDVYFIKTGSDRSVLIGGDKRDRMVAAMDLRQKVPNAVPSVDIEDLLMKANVEYTNQLLQNNIKLLPLSGISNSPTVLCNEVGKWVVADSDAYGFNNGEPSWNKNGVPLMVVGDSFAQGYCVDQGQDVTGLLRAYGYNANSVGISGNASLIELGTIKEYMKTFQPKVVLWLYYENDLRGLLNEFRFPLLRRYLNEPEFRQGLPDKVGETDDFWNLLITQRQFDKALLIDSNMGVIDPLAYAQNGYDKWYGAGAILPSSPIYTEKAVSVFTDVMKEAKRWTEAHNAKLVFVYLPSIISAVGDGIVTKKPVIDAVSSLNIPVIDFWKTLHSKDDPQSFYQGHYTPEGYALLTEDIVAHLTSEKYPPAVKEVNSQIASLSWDSIDKSLYTHYSRLPVIENGSFENGITGWAGPGDCTIGWPGRAKFTYSISTDAAQGSNSLSMTSSNHVLGILTRPSGLERDKLYELSFRYKNIHLDLDGRPKTDSSKLKDLYCLHDKFGELTALALPKTFHLSPSRLKRFTTLYHLRKILAHKRGALKASNDWQDAEIFFIARDTDTTFSFYCPSNGSFTNSCLFNDVQITPINTTAVNSKNDRTEVNEVKESKGNEPKIRYSSWNSLDKSLYTNYTAVPVIENGSFEDGIKGWAGPGDCTVGRPGPAKFAYSISTDAAQGSKSLSMTSSNHVLGILTKPSGLEPDKLYELSFRYKNIHSDLDGRPKTDSSRLSELYYLYDKLGELHPLNLPATINTLRPSKWRILFDRLKNAIHKKKDVAKISGDSWQEAEIFFIARDSTATLYFYCPSDGSFVNSCFFDDVRINSINAALLGSQVSRS